MTSQTTTTTGRESHILWIVLGLLGLVIALKWMSAPSRLSVDVRVRFQR